MNASGTTAASPTAGDAPTTDFWDANQPGFRFTSHRPGSPEFYTDVERHRYALEPHIPELARFESWSGKDVLEVGCGIGTDGARFAACGARYRGIDMSAAALGLARRRFELAGLTGDFHVAPADALPFAESSLDLVYSHGVLHHIPPTAEAVSEIHRVLRPGGVALVMLYHRDSFNYRVNIMCIRRLLAAALLVPGAASLVAHLTGEPTDLLEGHRTLLRQHGLRYLTDAELFLSNNTDGPGNALSKVYSRAEARDLFSSFASVALSIRYLNLRLIPFGPRLAASGLGRRLERRVGWHLYISALK